jgi:hypothetical protein
LGSWHGHLITMERRQCAFFVHDETRYALFLPGLRKEYFARLDQLHRKLFLAALAGDGLSSGRLARVSLALGPAHYDSKTDRSVLGSLRVTADDLYYTQPRWGELMSIDPLAICHWLNQRPTRARGKPLWPAQAMAERIDRL